MNSSTTTRRAGTVLAAGFLVALIGGGARFALGLTLKPVADEFHWPRSTLGLAVLVYFVVTAVCTFGAGKLADRVSLRLLMGTGIALSGIGIGLMGFMSEPWHAIALFGVLFAIGNGGTSVTPIGVMVMRAAPGRAGIVNSLAVSGMTVGQLVMIAGLSVVLAAVGWRWVFYWLAFVHLAFLIMLLPMIPGRREAKAHAAAPATTGMTLREAARTRQFWLLVAIFAVCGLDDFLVTTHVVALAQDRGLDALLAGNLLAGMGLMALIGILIAGVWADRSGPKGPTVASFVLRVPVLALICYDQSAISLAIFAVVFGLTFIVTAPMTMLFVRDAFGTRHLGAIGGMVTLVHQVFGGIGAYAGAAIFDATGTYVLAFIIMLVGTTVASVLSLALTPSPGSKTAA